MPQDDYQYLGAQDANSGASNFNVTTFISEQVRSQISTATLVKIVKAPYDANGNPIAPGAAVPVGYVDVLPLVNQIDGYGNATPHQTVYHLSYYRYQGGLGAVIIDPAVGDIGKMVVADRDTSAVRATGMQSNPGSRRQYDKADGTYFGCTQAAAPNQFIAFTEDGITIQDKNGNKMVMSSAGIAFTSASLTNTGEITAGQGGSDSVTLQQHRHGTGTAASGTVVPTPGT